MDAHAHLMSLGWQGDGHALDARPYKQKGHRGLAYDPKQVRSTGGNGLVKPLLISQRQHRFGIGKKAHEPPAGNEWWLSGFEKALGNIGKSESEREETSASGTATPESSSGYSGKHAGLYGFFVRGQAIGGTIGMEKESRTTRKRKSDEMLNGETKSSRQNSSSDLSYKAGQKEASADDFEQVGVFLAARDKDERRKRKAERLGALEEFQQVEQFFEARSEQRKKEQQSSEFGYTAELEVPEELLAVREETKEERKERRRRRREEKAAQAAKSLTDTDDVKEVADFPNVAAAKAARKAERKERKEEKSVVRPP